MKKKTILGKGKVYCAEITDLNNLGSGVTRIEGKVVFVQHAVDGDVAEIQIIKETADYGVARIQRLLSPSPHRMAAVCPLTKRCGGCLYGEIHYTHELALKKERVENAFRKNGFHPGEDIWIDDVRSTGQTVHWRNKIQLPVGGVENGRLITGYYAPRSHTIVPSEGCPLHDPALDPIVDWLRRELAQRDFTGLRHLFLRKGCGGVQVCLIMTEIHPGEKELAQTLRKQFPIVISVWRCEHSGQGNVIWGDRFRLLDGQENLEDEMLGLHFEIAAPAFWQVNHDAAALALTLLREYAAPLPGDRILDLYCGTGVIGMTLAAALPDAQVTGIEIIPEAVQNAQKNALRNGLRNAQFLCGDAAEMLETIHADLIVIDPPRKGCDAKLLQKIAEASPRALLYMSCEPETLARDAAILQTLGYAPTKVSPVDLFPRTGHVECISLLHRKPLAK